MRKRTADADGTKDGQAARKGKNGTTPAAWLGRLRLGEPQVLPPHTLYPVFLDEPGPSPKLLLTHQAFEAGLLEVHEQAEGVVQELLAWNKGLDPVVILEGDTLVGCKQNRVVARSVVLGGGVKLPIPVGCMEQGRWGWRTRGFSSGSLRMSPSIRGTTSADIRTAKKQRSARVALDQSRLWEDVEACLCGESISSPSSDYHALLEAKEREARERLGALKTRPGQVGILFTAEGVFLGLEVAGHPDTWSALAPRTLPSYVIDREWSRAVAAGKEKGGLSDASLWLERLKKAPLDLTPGLGLGEEVDFEDAALGGSGLWFQGEMVHMAVFPQV
jgi:hypothetical protein